MLSALSVTNQFFECSRAGLLHVRLLRQAKILGKVTAIQTCWISFHHQIQDLGRDKYDLLNVLSLQILDHCRQRLRSSHSIIL